MSSSISCIQRLFVVINPVVSSTLQLGQGICIISRLMYVTPMPVHHSPIGSSDIPYQSFPRWKVMALDFATFDTSPHWWNRTASMFRVP